MLGSLCVPEPERGEEFIESTEPMDADSTGSWPDQG